MIQNNKLIVVGTLIKELGIQYIITDFLYCYGLGPPEIKIGFKEYSGNNNYIIYQDVNCFDQRVKSGRIKLL